MKYKAKYLIDKRIEKWNSNSEEVRLQEDKKLREAIANELVVDRELREEVQKNLLSFFFMWLIKNKKQYHLY